MKKEKTYKAWGRQKNSTFCFCTTEIKAKSKKEANEKLMKLGYELDGQPYTSK